MICAEYVSAESACGCGLFRYLGDERFQLALSVGLGMNIMGGDQFRDQQQQQQQPGSDGAPSAPGTPAPAADAKAAAASRPAQPAAEVTFGGL
jgi:hypothetical protein